MDLPQGGPTSSDLGPIFQLTKLNPTPVYIPVKPMQVPKIVKADGYKWALSPYKHESTDTGYLMLRINFRDAAKMGSVAKFPYELFLQSIRASDYELKNLLMVRFIDRWIYTCAPAADITQQTCDEVVVRGAVASINHCILLSNTYGWTEYKDTDALLKSLTIHPLWNAPGHTSVTLSAFDVPASVTLAKYMYSVRRAIMAKRYDDKFYWTSVKSVPLALTCTIYMTLSPDEKREYDAAYARDVAQIQATSSLELGNMLNPAPPRTDEASAPPVYERCMTTSGGSEGTVATSS
jgi:hypothetical protein